MPRTKLSKEQDSLKDIGKLLRLWQYEQKQSDSTLGKQLHMSARTWQRRKKEPNRMTILELWRAAKILKIPKEIALKALTAGLD